jgi:formylglycine-generating enzyme required for sulfatase activity
VVTHPDRAPVRYPVFIARQAHWHGVPPGAERPRPILLPPGPELGPEDCYVPAGWFWSGGASVSERMLPLQRVWCEGWVVRRFPVTNREYIVFLDDLIKRGQLEEALRFAPRERGGNLGGQGSQIYGFDGQQFSLRADADGHVWSPSWPVCMVDWFGASTYAAWEGERSGLPWVLPSERIWEKAARGADGRAYPWGDTFDSAWAWTQGSHRDAPLPSAVGHREGDESPYGVRDVAGNMSDWCAWDAPEADTTDAGRTDTVKPHRGGTWTGTAAYSQAAMRRYSIAEGRVGGIGFRLARRWPC